MNRNRADNDVARSLAIYSKQNLKLYDLIVLGISNIFIWRCPTRMLLGWYNRHVSGNHLDVGVGTGYFPAHAVFPDDTLRLGLMDLHEPCLERAARRLQYLRPEIYRQNILEPLRETIEPFESIGLNYVLHCLPGNIPQKAIVFQTLKKLLVPGGTFFGSTILARGVPVNFPAKRLMKAYNKQGVFNNIADGLQDLETCLAGNFKQVQLKTVGSVALFAASDRQTDF